jgi:hypothetical protein
VRLTDELLDALKTALFDPTLPQPKIGEINEVEHVLARLQRIDGVELIDECTRWATRYPGTTSGLVHAARAIEKAERLALRQYLQARCHSAGGLQGDALHSPDAVWAKFGRRHGKCPVIPCSFEIDFRASKHLKCRT